MLTRRKLSWAWSVMLLCATGTVWAASPPQTQPSVDAKMAAMQSQMQQMQSQLQQTQTQLQQTQSQLQQTQTALKQTQTATAVNFKDEQQAIQEVLRESDEHSGLLKLDSGPGTAGFDTYTGFFIRSDDGQTYLHPGILFDGFQTVNLQGRFNGEAASGLIQLIADGSLYSKDFTYNFLIDEGGGPATIEESWGQYTFAHDVLDGHDASVRLGRIKDPAFKETSINLDQNQLFTTPSQASNLVGGGWAEPILDGGEVILGGDQTPWHAGVAVAGGPALMTTDALGDDLVEQGILVSSRFDYKIKGDWRDTEDMTGRNLGQTDLFDIGGGLEGIDTGNEGGVKGVRGTVDAQYQAAQAWTVFAALYGDCLGIYEAPGTQIGDRDDGGATIQGGYSLTKSLQAIGVYSITCVDHRFDINGNTTFQEVGGGLNYFLGPDGAWANHGKFTFQCVYVPHGVAPSDDDAASTRSNILFVGQFQIWL